MKKVLILGGSVGKVPALVLQDIKEKFGDVLVYTAQEAKEQGLSEKDFVNTPTFLIEPSPVLPLHEPLNSIFMGSEKVGKGGRARNKSKFRR